MGIKDIDRNTNVIPFISYENRYVRWFGPNLDVKLPNLQINQEQRIAFTLSAGYDFSGYDDDDIEDTPILQGMDERDGGFVIGATAQWQNPIVNVSAVKEHRLCLDNLKTGKNANDINDSPIDFSRWQPKLWLGIYVILHVIE